MIATDWNNVHSVTCTLVRDHSDDCGTKVEMNKYVAISLSVSHDHIARIHKAGCGDIAKDLRSGMAENITAENGADAARKYIAGELAEMGYSVLDVKVINCAK